MQHISLYHTLTRSPTETERYLVFFWDGALGFHLLKPEWTAENPDIQMTSEVLLNYNSLICSNKMFMVCINMQFSQRVAVLLIKVHALNKPWSEHLQHATGSMSTASHSLSLEGSSKPSSLSARTMPIKSTCRFHHNRKHETSSSVLEWHLLMQTSCHHRCS